MSLEFASATKKNIGRSKLDKLPGLIKYAIVVPNAFELADADILTASALTTAINTALKAAYGSRAYLYPPFVKCEDMTEETVREESPLTKIRVRKGQYGYRFHVSKNMFLHKAIASHEYINEGRIILVDLEGKMLLTTKTNGKHTGFRIALLDPEKMDLSDGSNSTTSPIYCWLQDNKEWDDNGKLIDASLVMGDLVPLTDVTIELAAGDAFAAAGFMVDVKNESDDTPVSGLLVADFVMVTADGVTLQVFDTAAEDANTPGRYNLIPDTVFVDGTLKLRAASALTTAGYENPERLWLEVNV